MTVPPRLRLTLYVAGDGVRNGRTLRVLRDLVEGEMGLSCEVTVVDVLTEPEAAERAMIIATPTLVRESPPPKRRLIGDLTDVRKVIANLEVDTDMRSLIRGGSQ